MTTEKDVIELADGAGGREMAELIASFAYGERGAWQCWDDDAALYDLGDGRLLAYTTDAYVVDPVFFPGGDIGHLAASGTINDLAVMGAEPLGLSVAFILEEGFPRADLEKTVSSVDAVSRETGVAIATGDTKVMPHGAVDKIVVTTSGVGVVEKDRVLTKEIEPGDAVIASGGLGEHAVALLSARFDYETDLVSDSKPVIEEIRAVRDRVKVAKDPTRGGIAATLNELAARHGVGLVLEEEAIPLKKEVATVADLLGVSPFELASEGRFIAVTAAEDAASVVKELRSFNQDAAIIGEVVDGRGVTLKTVLGQRTLPVPSGRLVPRIC